MSHRLLRLGIAASCAALAATALADTADATPEDVSFLNRLQQVGITTSNPYATVGYAHDVCRQIDSGVPVSRLVTAVLSDNPLFDRRAAEDYVVLANMTYCPPD